MFDCRGICSVCVCVRVWLGVDSAAVCVSCVSTKPVRVSVSVCMQPAGYW